MQDSRGLYPKSLQKLYTDISIKVYKQGNGVEEINLCFPIMKLKTMVEN